MMNKPAEDVVIVAIGRDEGERLKHCLRSAMGRSRGLVYVDSGSTDQSADFARALGCTVVELDRSQPFGPARARNEGFAAAIKLAPDIRFVQFLDGDCELTDGWLEKGMAAFADRPDVAIVCGSVRELHPQATVYNRLCDLEWQQPTGEVDSCAGRLMIRAEAFRALNGFRSDVMAAEDLELCYRVRQAGWKILHLDAEMARHDVAMTSLRQWWRRARRTGFAYAQVESLHGSSKERLFVRECARNWGWGLALPAVALALAPVTHGISLLALLCAYGLLFTRIYRFGRRNGWRSRDAVGDR